jgi:hypothetical protein
MSALVTALDNFTFSTQIGEKGHIENTWSTNIRDLIVQLSFQLTRTINDTQLNVLKQKFTSLIRNIQTQYLSKQISRAIYEEFIITLYKLIGHTRDIIDGKGEYTLAYMLLLVWFEYFPNSAKTMLSYFVQHADDEHPYGSWKDIKYFADICYVLNKQHPLIAYCVELLNTQLHKDSTDTTTKTSLVSKWIPREKSKFGWLFTELAKDYYKMYLPKNYDENNLKHRQALLKCKTHYRQLISLLNKRLDTTQIKQCANTWAAIEPSKQTSITMKRQSKAFLNLTKKGETKSTLQDRIVCATHFKEYIAKAVEGKVDIKGKRVGLNEFVKDAMDSHTQEEKDLLNAQWKNNATQTNTLQKMIAMVDTSGSMDGDPLYSAIGLGIRVAEKSLIGKRVMTFSATPRWVNLDNADNFVDMVKVIRASDWGTNTNFYAALELILKVIVRIKMPAEDVEGMTLAIFSDMQIDMADRTTNIDDMYTSISKLYAAAGIEVNGIPYKPPHILFWNLRSTTGFPVMTTQKNTSMMSGFSPALLNNFCENGMMSIQTPWDMFMQSLSSKRYDCIQEYMKEYLQSQP